MKTTIVHIYSFFIFLIFSSFSTITNAQTDRPSAPPKTGLTKTMTGVTTDGNYSATELIQDIFVGGDCFEVSNVTFSGNSSAVGYFNNGQTSIGFEEGVILATGPISNAQGPNTAANTGQNMFGGSDGDLVDIANQSIHDAAIIEFDFTPTTNQVSFEYVFASEEYCEYVGQSFNDAFGFFVSGPGINGGFSGGAENIALIPNTNTNISINTVNYQMNGTYYNDNGPIGQGGSGCVNEEVSSQGVAVNFLEYDGFTTVLTAVLDVIPCNTYHIKLAIGDGTDGVYDSAVFLKANSFNSGGTATVTAEVPHTNSSTGHESCSDGFFKFTRSASSDINLDLSIHFTLSNQGTATAGMDYSPALMSPAIIPAGQMEVLIPVNLILDDTVEGEETIVMELEQPCTCEDQFVTFTILDAEPISIEAEDLSLCEGIDSTLTPKVNGGVPGYNFLWNTGATSPNMPVLGVSADYIFEVTDVCNNQATKTISVNINPLPEISTEEKEVTCAGDRDGAISISMLQGTAPFQFQWADNSTEQNRTNLEGGNYFVTIIDQFECENTAEFFVFEPTPIEFSATAEPVTCYGDSDGFIKIDTVFGGRPDYLISFDGSGFQTTRNFDFLPAGAYPLEVEDVSGCITETLMIIEQPEELLLELGEDINIELGESVQIQAQSNFSTEDLIYNWQPEICNCPDTLFKPLNNLTLNLTVLNENGCSAQDEMRVFVTKPREVFFPNIFSPNGDGENDWFYPQAKKNVEMIETLTVWDRWGDQVFQQNELLPNNSNAGWDGNARGKNMRTGVYVYYAKVRFIDGEVLDVAGDVMIVK